MEATYFKFEKSFERKYFDPQNFDLLDDSLKKVVDEQTANFEKAIREFLVSKGYQIRENASREDYIQIVEQLKSEDRFIDYLLDTNIKEIENGFSCIYTYIPFFNSISNPIDKNTKQLLLENWRHFHDKDT